MSGDGAARRGTVYLLHFDRPYRHAAHYTGWTVDLPGRLAQHAAGHGARLLAVVHTAGIGWRLVRTWTGVGRARERQLKAQGGAARRLPGLPQPPPAGAAMSAAVPAGDLDPLVVATLLAGRRLSAREEQMLAGRHGPTPRCPGCCAGCGQSLSIPVGHPGRPRCLSCRHQLALPFPDGPAPAGASPTRSRR